MQTKYLPAIATAMLLCGCGESAHEKAMNKEIADLQTSNTSLSNQVSEMSSEVSDLFEIETNQLTQIEAFGDALKSVSQSSEPSPNGLASGIDPRTGLPEEPPLMVFPASGRVTESNEQWWRWSVKFAIGNRSAADETKDADIKFLDRDGYIVETKTEYHLALPPYSTNYFTSEEIVDLPEAQNIKSIEVTLE